MIRGAWDNKADPPGEHVGVKYASLSPVEKRRWDEEGLVGDWEGHDWNRENNGPDGDIFVGMPDLPTGGQASVEDEVDEDEDFDGDDDEEEEDISSFQDAANDDNSTERIAARRIDPLHFAAWDADLGQVPGIVFTPNTHNRCGLYALITSMQQQHPGLPQPTEAQLVTEAGNLFLPEDANFSASGLAQMIYNWGHRQERRLKIRFGYGLQERGPILHPIEHEPAMNNITVWVHNDNHSDLALARGEDITGLYEHWSGLRPQGSSNADNDETEAPVPDEFVVEEAGTLQTDEDDEDWVEE